MHWRFQLRRMASWWWGSAPTKRGTYTPRLEASLEWLTVWNREIYPSVGIRTAGRYIFTGPASARQGLPIGISHRKENGLEACSGRSHRCLHHRTYPDDTRREDLRLWFPSNPRRSLFGGGPEVDSHSSYLARVNQAVTFFTSYQFATLNVVSSLFPQAVKA
jgi:hypothetical protein